MVGANCDPEKPSTEIIEPAPPGLYQMKSHGPEEEGDKMPPWNSWDQNTLPLCKHWRNAHEVPYPMVGANCVNGPRHEELPKDALA